MLERANQMNEEVATEIPTEISKYQTNARAFLNRLEMYANQIQLGPEYQEEIEDLEDRIENPRTTPSARLVNHIKDDSLVEYALIRAKRYQNSALQSIRPFTGFDIAGNLSAEDLKLQLFKGNWEPGMDK